jgi:ABC-type dipeptide transport system, periplasmic component
MKRRMHWLLISCLAVSALLMTSCGEAEEEEEVAEEEEEVTEEEEVAEEEEEEEGAEMVTLTLTKMDGTKVTKTVEKPQYGGTIYACCTQQTENFDPAGRGLFLDPLCQYNVYQTLVTFDWTRGPAGTGEVKYVGINSADEYWIPLLAESFEMPDNKTIVYKIRKGLHFHDKPPANGRELTVDDCVESILRCARVRGGSRIKVERGDKVYARDEDTVVVEMVNVILAPVKSALFDMWIYAPETVDENDKIPWRDVCSIGPYMLQDYISASTITLVRNPDYWQYDPLHPENKLPYADTIVSLIISEPATRLAALRTSKIDRIVGLSWEEAASLKTSAPGILQYEGPGTLSYTIHLRADKEPLDDINVRRALTMAIDRETILQEYLDGHGLLDWAPILVDTPAYTPIDELPEDLQELWGYHPDTARQLLVDAGYGTGFTLDVLYSDRPEPWG